MIRLLFIYTCFSFLFGLNTLYAQNLDQLPLGARYLLQDEQTRILDNWGDPMKYMDHKNEQNQNFRPEARQVFLVKSYWVPANLWHAFESPSFTGEDERLFKQTLSDGSVWYRFLVHPESEVFFSEFLKGSRQAEDFWATATSSSRTLLMWRDGFESRPFFGKLSLDAKIGTWRIMRPAEIVRSVGTSSILELSDQILPENFAYFPEIFGLTPKGADAGGMIIRQIPDDILSGERRVRPLFALFAQAPEDPFPAFVDMIKSTGFRASEFFENYLIRPWIHHWLTMIINHGINFEDHSQNLLLEISDDGFLTHRFWHRDFGGFSIDLGFRRRSGLPTPADLPYIRTEDIDYSQDQVQVRLARVAYLHFSGGVLYNIDRLVPEWINRGWIPKEDWSVQQSELAFRKILTEELSLLANRSVSLSDQYENLDKIIEDIRKSSRRLHEDPVEPISILESIRQLCRLVLRRP